MPIIGDTAFEVRWCAEIPVDDCGDSDLDAADYRAKAFRSLAAAQKYARKVFPHDAFGSVRIVPVEFVPYDDDDAKSMPHVGYWEDVGETKYYEGEESQNLNSR